MLILGAVATSMVAFAQAQSQSRIIPPGDGVIAGRVIDAVTKRPIPETTVRLRPRLGEWARAPGDEPWRQIVTRATGDFQFLRLGPAEYELTASHYGYSEGGAGKSWSRGEGAPILLAQGQSITTLDLLMWPVGHLSGRVLDERGMPVAGAHLNVIEEGFRDGLRQFTGHVAGGNTDERGEYHFQVPSTGRAIVCVTSHYTTYAIPPLVAGHRAAYGLPTGRLPIEPFDDVPSMLISQDGRHLVQFRLLPPPIGANGEREAYVNTCAPSATSSTDATVVEFKSGSISAPDLILQPRRSIRISGRLFGPEGPLGRALLRLVPAVEDPAFTFATVTQALSAIDGTFSFLIVPSGSYKWEVYAPNSAPTVAASASGFPSVSTPHSSSGDRHGYWISEPPIQVGAGDIENLSLTARRGVAVSGTVVVDGGTPPAPARPFLALKSPGDSFEGFVQAAQDGRFEIQGVKPGRYALTVSASGFSIVEMTSGVQDLIDVPLDVGEQGTSGIVVRMSSRPARIAGVVRDTNASVVPNATVIIFPGDDRAWRTYGQQKLRIRCIRGVTGRFEFTNLPPGDYRLAAIDDSLMARWLDPALFALIEPTAQRVHLQPGEQLTINLVKR